MKKFVILILSALVLLFALSFALVGCKSSKAKSNPVLNSSTPPQAAPGVKPGEQGGTTPTGPGSMKGATGNEGGDEGG
jgi:predicted component of type VI protein secretion system